MDDGGSTTLEARSDSAEAQATAFPLGGGDLGQLIRSFDWGRTSLGPLSDWPQSLKTATNMLLLSPVPIVLLWGEDGVMIYNDAYSEFAGGRHPRLLGSKVREGWPEVAAFNDNVMRVGLAGDTLAYKDQELTLYRHGRPEQVWMNLDYSPVLDESGRPAGVIAIVVETSERVRAERQLRAEQERLTQLFEQAPGLMAMLSGPDHVFTLANPAFRTLVGPRDLIGKPVRTALPEVERQGVVALLDEVYRSGRAYTGSGVTIVLQRGPEAGEEERILDFVYQPVTDADGEVGGVFIEGQDVTERAAAQARMRESEERFRALVNATSDVVYQMSPDWSEMRLLDGKRFVPDTKNPSANWIDAYIDPGDRERVCSAIGEAIRARRVFELEHRVRRVDGSLGWTLSRAVPILDAQGAIVEWFGAAKDVSSRRLAEETVRANEARLRFLDALGKEVAKSTNADAILAATTRMLGEHLAVAICAYADMDVDADGFTIRGDWSAPGTRSIVGCYRLVEFGVLAAERLRAGLPLVLNDCAAALPPEEAETFLRFDLAATICVPLVKDGRLTALMAIHDRAPRAWTEREVALLTEVAERSWAHIERVRSEAAVRRGEQLFRERLEAQVAERTAALQQSEANIRTIFETSHLHQGLMAADGTLLYANATSLAGIDARLEEVKGRPYWDTPWFTGTPGVPETLRAAAERVAAGATENMDMVLELPTGTRSFEFSLRPVKDAAGAVVGMVPEAVETTARLKAEEVLRQAQKLEAVGQLTGGVAHDFNNLLTIIRSSVDFLRRPDLPEQRRRRYIDAVSDTVDRAAKLTGQLLAFARRQALNPEVFEVGQCLRAVSDMLDTVTGSRITVQTLLPDKPCYVRADRSQFETALVNIAVNARDAMDGEGTLTVHLAGEPPMLPAHGHGNSAGPFALVSLTDIGAGIPPEILKRVFEPFFTTKAVGKGTGLGLSQVFGFAKQSGGDIAVESTVGTGTTFTLYLPQVEPEMGGTSPLRASEEPLPLTQGGGRRVLVVEDNVEVGRFANQTLQDLGYATVWVVNANEALARLDEEASGFDVVFSDVVMPGMNGVALGQVIRNRFPSLPVVLASGYSDVLAEEGRHDFELLQKPYSVEQLSRVLRAVTHRQSNVGVDPR